MSSRPTTETDEPRNDEPEVYLGNERYHASRGPFGCACPCYKNLETGTLDDARERGLTPCDECEPVDYRERLVNGGEL